MGLVEVGSAAGFFEDYLNMCQSLAVLGFACFVSYPSSSLAGSSIWNGGRLYLGMHCGR
jgi:hypothetical protein